MCMDPTGAKQEYCAGVAVLVRQPIKQGVIQVKAFYLVCAIAQQAT